MTIDWNRWRDATRELQDTNEKLKGEHDRTVAELKHQVLLAQVFFLVALKKVNLNVVLVPLREVLWSD